jgi:hypothetical protein
MSKPDRRAPRALPPVADHERAQHPCIDPQLVASVRVVINNLLQLYPALQAVNIQLIYLDAGGELRADTEVGLAAQTPIKADELLKIFAVSLAAQSPQLIVQAEYATGLLPAPPQSH